MKDKQVIKRIDEIYLDDGYKDYDSLPDDLKAELAALSIRDLGNFRHEVLVESKGCEDIIDSLLVHLLNGTLDSAENLADTMVKTAIDYFAKSLEELYAERVNDLECERMREGGLHPIVDRINGEVRWIR